MTIRYKRVADLYDDRWAWARMREWLERRPSVVARYMDMVMLPGDDEYEPCFGGPSW